MQSGPQSPPALMARTGQKGKQTKNHRGELQTVEFCEEKPRVRGMSTAGGLCFGDPERPISGKSWAFLGARTAPCSHKSSDVHLRHGCQRHVQGETSRRS